MLFVSHKKKCQRRQARQGQLPKDGAGKLAPLSFYFALLNVYMSILTLITTKLLDGFASLASSHIYALFYQDKGSGNRRW